MNWLIPYMKEHKRLLAVVVFLGSLTIFAASALLFSSGYLISKAASRPENLLMIYVPIVMVRTFGIMRSVSRYLDRLTSHSLILTIVSRMRVRLYEALRPQTARFKTGDALSLFADDIEHLQDVYIKLIFPWLSALLLYIVSIAALGYFSVPFALVMGLYFFVFTVLVPLVSLLVTKAKQTRQKEQRAAQYSQLADAVMGLGDWIFSGRQRSFIDSYERREEEWTKIEAFKRSFTRGRDFALQLLIGTAVVAMMIWAGGQSTSGQIAPVLIAAFTLVLFPITEAFLPLSSAAESWSGWSHSLNRLDAVEQGKSQQAKTASPAASSSAAIALQDVSFSYNEQAPIFDHFHMAIEHGEKVAILGPSGSGKSTLMQLAFGLIAPQNGVVLINGYEPDDDISREIAVLNQQPYLFNTTVMNNVRLAKPNASDQEVMEAVKKVHLHDYIQALPNGYHTMMQEAGARFSGGERQRIALARVLLQQTPIVILDEPTIGLDPITERQLMDTVFEVLHGNTIVWITHHLAGMEKMDRIVFLEEGKIQMDGPPAELFAANTRYKRLYELDYGLMS
ncbi:thiol reductant ABC exporter subunit CydC [Domibacillus enclensis]|uniref:ATP-binding cassette, subfamily C, CydC n=1 Tax=Domibacillus enclensis TaxID=1017273 RepID=A0A1N6ZGU9_9BACI|nr:thiol reductant ABC exporter subunit CydC [Domibacillus enclensis]OXS76699.1 amino acid ABC transporter ATP-binding protein [Domibacillus enclensis]SIR25994.1 ATP-binding cassette, subfamily C, CydC [Domibacillus enclensis]